MKKIIKIFTTIIVILILCWGTIFCIDYFRCINLKMPLFVKAKENETADDGCSGTYYGLGYKVEVRKYLSAEYGVQLQKVEMYMFNKMIAGAIANNNETDEITKEYTNTERNNNKFNIGR